MARPGIMLYFDILEPIKVLPDADKGRLLVAMLEYGQTGTVPVFDGMLALAWGFVKPKIDKDEAEYNQSVLRRQYATTCRERKKKGDTKFAAFIAGIVCSNIIVWLFEKFVDWEYEFLSLTYIAAEIMLLLVYWMMQDYVHKKDIPVHTPQEQEQLGVDIATMPMDVKIGKVLLCLKNGETLAPREREVLELILQYKKRREIAELLFVSESSVKLYTRTLYSKLGVTSREELYALLVQKNED